jgi:hypothetical protein
MKFCRAKPSPHSGLLLSCSQIFEEAATLKTNKTVEICGAWTLPGELNGKFGDCVDELIYGGDEEQQEWIVVENLLEKGDIEEYSSNILLLMAEDTIWIKQAYSTVRFARFLSPSPIPASINVEWVFKVDDRRLPARPTYPRDCIREVIEREVILKEKATLQARGVDRVLKHFVANMCAQDSF